MLWLTLWMGGFVASAEAALPSTDLPGQLTVDTYTHADAHTDTQRPALPSPPSFDPRDRMIAFATVSEAYDGLGNLLTQSHGGTRSITLAYDMATNRVTSSVDYRPNNGNDLTGTRAITYDNRGNMATLGGMSFTYDLSDQMLSASGTADGYGPISATYLYNGEGKRVQMTANGRNSFYVYDNAGRIVLSHKEHDGEGVEHLYLEAGPRLAKWTGTALTYLHVDHLGTTLRGTHGMGVQDAIDGTPAAVGDEIFHDFSTPFGLSPRSNWYVALNSYSSAAQPTGQGSNCGVLGFTTHVKDCETGLQYMQARYYDPVLARFTTVDPQTMMSMGMHPGYVNRYAYVLNDPVNGVDPTGEFCVGVCQNVLAIHAGAAARNPGGYAAGVARGAPRAITGSVDMAMSYGPGSSPASRAVVAGPYGSTNAYNNAIGPATSPEMALGEQTGEIAAELAGGGAGLAKAFTKSAVKQSLKGVPKDWIASPTQKGGGVRYTNPNNKHDFVRDMPGNPDSPNPAQQNPYVVRSNNGQIVDGDGNPTSSKSPEAHIPREDFKFD